ncbi:putative disease resistance protein At1g50180 [Chenopodium quinoa]|uniref:putative disease resistance protein At1g50180 n=1 Tax=Chenopodium quinoa TaxID=63459 RepID=UPI000B783719|nr:putative disease resistance protein At1g50180 [Chenopodium quinoa]
MADIQSAAQWLGRLVIEEARYLANVEDKVKELRDELDWMHCFLSNADASKYDNAMARRWVARIREFAYEAEDTIERFLIRVDTRSTRRRDILGLVKKYSGFLWEARLIHEIGSEIDSLKQKISFLTSKLHTYDIKLTMGESSSSWLLRKKITFKGSVKENIIGRDKDMDEVVGKLTKKEGTVVSICGDAGVGKTFLAKKIFDKKEIRKHFEAFAWAYVSSPCQSSAVQQDLLSSLTSKSKEQISQMTDDELKTELLKVLRKSKCFIVLDGVWGNEVWDRLKKSFPFASLDNGSKLLITNQLEEVAEHVDPRAYICRLEPLDANQSKQLLEEKLKIVENNPPDKSDQTDPRGIKDNVLKFCKGLPLLISVLGGVLATKKTLKDWEDVNKYISSYLTEDHQQVPSWKRILELSYYDLPFQLKPSFLYLGYFPTNLEIPAKKIIRLWEAEGLVSSSDDETSEDTLEDVAEHCLAELVERSLVQVGSRGLTGKVKTFLVHNLMRDLCMTKATQGNLLSIVKVGSEENQAEGKSSKSRKASKLEKKKFRRLAIYYSGKSSDKLPGDYDQARHIRSLLFFNTLSSDDVLIPLKGLLLRKAFNRYKLLRVLDIENIEMHSLPDEVGFLIHLRYLSIRGSWVSSLPSSIKNLRCLQTLDLRVLSFVHVRIPDVLWKLERLLHLYLPSKLFNLRHEAANLQLKGLRSLETLSNFGNKCRAEDVVELYNLRRFFSSDFLSDDNSIKPLLSPTSKLKHLERVSLKLEGHILKGYSQTLASRRLRKLWVRGEVEQPIKDIKFPEKLTRLSLHYTKFQSDPMEVLEKLISLKKLSLKHDSYTGVDMKCSSFYFKELEYLTLKGLESLNVWIVEAKAMPKLSHLKINGCQKLEVLPDGLRFVENLQELAISFMPCSFFGWNSPKDLTKWAQCRNVEHVPCINVSYVLDLKDEYFPIEMPGCQGSTSQVPEMQESECCCRESS